MLYLYPTHQGQHLWGMRNSLLQIPLLQDNMNYELFTMLNNDTFALNTMIMSNIKTLYEPGKHLALDEMLRKFFGRFEFKHRIPSKPAKERLKTFLIALMTVIKGMGFGNCRFITLLFNLLKLWPTRCTWATSSLLTDYHWTILFKQTLATSLGTHARCKHLCRLKVPGIHPIDAFCILQ